MAAADWEVILNFHGIGVPPPGLPSDELPYWIEVEFFERVVELICASSSPVRLTFDDGNGSDLAIGAPVLAAAGLTATFFVLSGRIGQSGYLSEGDIRMLEELGMSVGSHGHAHVDWKTVDDDTLRFELSESRRIIEGISRQRVDSVAIPFGSYDRRVIRCARQAGYERMLTSDGGWARAGTFIRPRNSLRRSMSRDDVVRLLIHRGSLPRRLRRSVSMYLKAHA